MMDETNADRQAAALQISSATHAGGAGNALGSSAHRTASTFTTAIGLLVGSFLLVVVYVYPSRMLWLTLSVTAAYGVGITVASVWFQRARRAAERGWGRRYTVGVLTTMAFYTVGVMIAGVPELQTPAFWVPYAIATAVPVVIAGLLRGAR